MSLKSIAAKLFAKYIVSSISKWSLHPEETQKRVFETLVKNAKDTEFGVDHDFKNILDYNSFQQRVPIRDYEALRPYIDKVVAGNSNILWPGKPLYFAKTSGTTSGAKYIPLTKESMPSHIQSTRNAILCYINETNNTNFVSGKMIFLQGSPELDEKNGIKLGRLSGIAAHYVPQYLQRNRLPKWETNCIEDWEEKVDAIVEETKSENMTVIGGIPSWVQMYFERLQQQTNQPIGQLFPNFNLFIYGGVNYEPYRKKFETLIGKKVDSIELFPASEGFFAFQDKQSEKGMLLQLNSGIFYEFIEVSQFYSKTPKRLTIGEVEIGVNYVMIISTNAGLWGYNVGDTIQFTHKKPHRVIVTGRLKHFISAFGEHVIGKEVEQAMQVAIDKHEMSITEFTVAPFTQTKENELPYHQWLVEFENMPNDLNQVAETLDHSLCKQNSYYNDLISGKVLQPLRILPLKKGSFTTYMKSKGKLGGQNKVPRLSNDRNIADALEKLQD